MYRIVTAPAPSERTPTPSQINFLGPCLLEPAPYQHPDSSGIPVLYYGAGTGYLALNKIEELLTTEKNTAQVTGKILSDTGTGNIPVPVIPGNSKRQPWMILPSWLGKVESVRPERGAALVLATP